jgi:hypothetical protein
MAAFGWAETYHRNTRRKSVFHAAAALCDISLSAAADHAMHRRAPMPAEQVHWDGAKDKDAVLPIMGRPGDLAQRNRKRLRGTTASTITTYGAEETFGLQGVEARLASCQPGLAAQPSQVFNLKFRLTLMRFICRWAPHFDGPVVRVTEFYPLYPTNSDTTRR